MVSGEPEEWVSSEALRTVLLTTDGQGKKAKCRALDELLRRATTGSRIEGEVFAALNGAPLGFGAVLGDSIARKLAQRVASALRSTEGTEEP